MLHGLGWTDDDIDRLRVRGHGAPDDPKHVPSDFIFSYVPKADKKGCAEIKRFIKRYEWMQTLGKGVTHRFVVRTKRDNLLAGVCVMSLPNEFSTNLLGPEYRDREKLIARGACASWAPGSLGKWLVRKSVRWTAKEYWRKPNRPGEWFCLFTAYADPKARELGKIYQDVGFIYLGQQQGRGHEYFDLDHPEWGWFNGRRFRQPSQFRRYAQVNGIQWNPRWKSYGKMPSDVAKILRATSKAHESRCVKRKATPKHKYVYIEGRSHNETKVLRRLFRGLHPGWNPDPSRLGLPYPKNRTPPPAPPTVLMPAGMKQAVVLDREDAHRLPYQGSRLNGGYVVARGESFCRPLHRQLVNAKLGDYYTFRNGDRRDIRRENIVPTTLAEIARRRPTLSRYGRGVTREGTRFVARISHRSHKFTLDRFPTAEEAAHCYDAFARWLGGERAPVNFPDAVPDPRQYVSAHQRVTAALKGVAAA